MTNANVDIHLGVYLERPDGQIAYTYSCNKEREVGYYLKDYDGPYMASTEEYATWKLRRDLKDWPDSKDPVLPYEFDLFFDIKRISELKAMFNNDAVVRAAIRAKQKQRTLLEEVIGRHINHSPELAALAAELGIEPTPKENKDE